MYAGAELRALLGARRHAHVEVGQALRAVVEGVAVDLLRDAVHVAHARAAVVPPGAALAVDEAADVLVLLLRVVGRRLADGEEQAVAALRESGG